MLEDKLQDQESIPETKALARSAPLSVASDKKPSASLYAGFWWRLAALLVDLTITLIAGSIFVYAASWLYGQVFGQLAPKWLGVSTFIMVLWLYHALFDSSSWKGTPGKRLFGLRTTGMEGGQLTFYRASFRFACRIASWSLCLGGFFSILLSKKKQTMHDIIAKCLVVRRVGQAPVLIIFKWLPEHARVVAGKYSIVWIIAFCAMTMCMMLQSFNYLLEPYFLAQNAREVVSASMVEVRKAEEYVGAETMRNGKYPESLPEAIVQKMRLPVGVSLRYFPLNGFLDLDFSANPYLQGRTISMAPTLGAAGIGWVCKASKVHPDILPKKCGGVR